MTLTQDGLQAALSEWTDEVFLECLTIEHEDLSEAIRLVNDRQNLFRATAEIWDFNGSADGWTARNSTFSLGASYLSIVGDAGAAVPGDMYVRSPDPLGIDGSAHSLIRMRFRRVAGSGWDGRLTYQTGSHGFSLSNYMKDAPDPTTATLSITNHDFEDGDTAWDKGTGWGVGEYGTSRSGTWSARCTNSDGSSSHLVSDLLSLGDISEGEELLFGGWINLSADWAGDSATPVLLFYDDEDSFVDARTPAPSDRASTAGEGWVLIRNSYEVPEGATQIRIRCSSFAQTAGTVYFDDAFITASGWTIAEWDMSDLDSGGDDWITSTVDEILINLGTSIQDIFDIDWIAVGGEYIAFPFQARLHARSEERVAEGEIVADNVDQRLVQNLRGLGDGATVTYEVVLASATPDDVEQGPFEFEIQGFVADPQTIQMKIGFDHSFLNEAFPMGYFTPANA